MLLLFACEAQDPIPLTPAEKAGQDIVSTHLDLDLTALTGHATLTADSCGP